MLTNLVMHFIECLLNFSSQSVLSLRLNHLVDIRVRVCLGLIFYVRFKVTVFASLRRRVKRTLNDLCCPCLSLKVMV